MTHSIAQTLLEEIAAEIAGPLGSVTPTNYKAILPDVDIYSSWGGLPDVYIGGGRYFATNLNGPVDDLFLVNLTGARITGSTVDELLAYRVTASTFNLDTVGEMNFLKVSYSTIKANLVENGQSTGDFNYFQFGSLTEEFELNGGEQQTLFVWNADEASVTISGEQGSQFTTYSFEGGELEVINSEDVSVYAVNASASSSTFENVDGGQVRIYGDGVVVDAGDSQLDTLRVGDEAEIFTWLSQVDNLDMGRWGELDIYNSFVNGEVGYGTDVYASNSRTILELGGGNNVTISGGQALIDADNRRTDEFEFENGAEVDGIFDEFDIIRLASGAKWTAGQLFSDTNEREVSVRELPGEVVLAAEVVDYDNGWDFSGKG